jgi:hypothetical protein
MWDFDIGKTLGILTRTAPFIVFRLVVYLGIALAYVAAVGVGSGAGYIVSKALSSPGATFWGGAVGFGLVSAALYWAREYLLYLVKAGHIAVMVELLDGRELPAGRSQIDHAQAIVRERFAETSVLFGIDQLIKGILRTLNGIMFTVAAFLPIPGLSSAVEFFNKLLNMALTYTDEVILAYNIRTGSENPWASSRTALILYAQNFKPILKNAFFLLLISWAFVVVLFLVIMLPAAGIAAMMHAQGSIWVWVIAGIFTLSLKAALLEPFAICALMQAYFKLIEGQQPDPEWEAKLSSLSDKFRKLGDQAGSYVPQVPATTAA